MYRLHYAPSNASIAPHMLLEELGVPFELALVDRDNGALQSPDYLNLNPNGLIPTFEDGDLVLWETAAIMLHLVDRHPEAGLAPPVGTPERAHFYKWMIHLTNTIQPEYIIYYYPHRRTNDPAAVPGIKTHAEARLGEMFQRIDRQLGDGPYLMGDKLSAADFMLLMMIRWGRNFAVPPRELPHLKAFCAHMLERPSVRRVFAREGLPQPFV